MTNRFVALRVPPRRRRYPVRVAALAVLVLAVAAQLWLVALGVVVAALALARLHHRHARRLLPALLAKRALLAQRQPAAAVEEWTTTWLAILAGGRPRHLRRAADLVMAREEDPWRAHVAAARLDAAVDALTAGEILGLAPSRHGFSPSLRVAAWGGLATLLLAMFAGSAVGWLLPIVAALAGLSFSLIDLHEERLLPNLLAAQATDLEGAAASLGEEKTSVPDLIVLSGGDHRCLHRARRVIENHPRPLCGRDVACRQLREAESTVGNAAGGYVLVSDGGLHWWIGCLLL